MENKKEYIPGIKVPEELLKAFGLSFDDVVNRLEIIFDAEDLVKLTVKTINNSEYVSFTLTERYISTEDLVNFANAIKKVYDN